jgi:hypothetical protein
MPNGTLLEVMEKLPDGWWLVRDIETGQQGWAVRGNSVNAWILCCAPASHASTSTAPDRGFITPSGNISCRYFKDDSDQTPNLTLRCDIRKHVTFNSRPADCNLELGDAFEIGRIVTMEQRYVMEIRLLAAAFPSFNTVECGTIVD